LEQIEFSSPVHLAFDELERVRVNVEFGDGYPKANPTDFIVVIFTGEESMWLPRPFLSGAEPAPRLFASPRGPNFPLSRLESRLMCPACGSRRVTVVFEPPSNAQVGRG
jgi:hypothetical protein